MEGSQRQTGAAIALFFLAPFVAEYLLGDLPLTLLVAMVAMAPMYGGGAVLIREVARRTHRGWPCMLLLAAGFAMLEEGFVTQSLFNPDYLKLHQHFLEPAHMRWIGMGGWWTMLMLNLHTFWSMGTSIALAEGLFPRRADRPWLGRVGVAVFAVIFVLGLLANWSFGFKQNAFTASPLQFAVAALALGLFVVLAFLTSRAGPAPRDGTVPKPWSCGGLALFAGVLLKLVPQRWGWGSVAAMLALDAAFLALVYAVSSRRAWSPLHTFSLGAGGALAYGLAAFTQPPVVGGPGPIVLISHVAFLTVAVALIVLGAKRSSAHYGRQAEA